LLGDFPGAPEIEVGDRNLEPEIPPPSGAETQRFRGVSRRKLISAEDVASDAQKVLQPIWNRLLHHVREVLKAKIYLRRAARRGVDVQLEHSLGAQGLAAGAPAQDEHVRVRHRAS
jgi:hypothetical protein